MLMSECLLYFVIDKHIFMTLPIVLIPQNNIAISELRCPSSPESSFAGVQTFVKQE